MNRVIHVAQGRFGFFLSLLRGGESSPHQAGIVELIFRQPQKKASCGAFLCLLLIIANLKAERD